MEASVSISSGGSGNANIDLTQVGSDIIPAYTNAYNLGNATNQWQDLWVSNATIYMNSVPLTADGANLKYNGNTVLTTSASLTFTNITAGQSGYVLLVNSGGYAITAAATTKVGATFLSTVSAAGTYLISYFSPDGTSVYCTASGALS